MKVSYMGKRQRKTEIRYKVYSTLNNRKKSKTSNGVHLYRFTLKFICTVSVLYLFVDILLSLNGF